MPDFVDKSVVEMEFRSQRFDAGVERTIETVDSLKETLNFDKQIADMSKLNDAGSQVDLGDMAESVSRVADRFTTLGIIGMTVIQDLTYSVLNFAKRVGSAVFFKPLIDGFREYELQMNSVQTILANTESKGTTLSDVTEALAELNKYADDTIYVFSQMTHAIGTFTASGVDLETSVAAIKGISNVAAISGSDAEQASRAYSAFSRALAEGHMTLLHWRSITTAGMGGEVFRNALIETARMNGIAVDQYIEETGGFRQSLYKGWVTNDILMETLSKFTGDLTEDQIRAMGYTEDQIAAVMRLGEMSNDAATKVKTFTQLRATLSEALGTGWAESFEIVLGDFEEAKALFTEVDSLLGGAIKNSTTMRNELLRGWKDAGGRLMLVDSARNVMEGLYEIIDAVVKGVRDIFPNATVADMHKWTVALLHLSEKFKMGEERLTKLRIIFKGFAAVIDIGRMFLVALFKAIRRIYYAIKPVDGVVLDTTSRFADFIVQIRNVIKASKPFEKFFKNLSDYILIAIDYIKRFIDYVKTIPQVRHTLDFVKTLNVEKLKTIFDKLSPKLVVVKDVTIKISDILKGIGYFIQKLAPLFTTFVGGVSEAVSKLTTGLSNPFANFDFQSFFAGLNTLLFAKLLHSGDTIIGDLQKLGWGIKGVLDETSDAIQDLQNAIKANTLLKIGKALLLLAISLVLIASIDRNRLVSSLEAISVLMVELFGATGVVGRLSNGINVKQTAKAILLMEGMALALVAMAVAVRIMGGVDAENMARALGGVTAMMVALVGAVNLIHSTKGVFTAAAAMLLIGTSLLIVSKAVKNFGSIDPKTLKQGLVATGAILTALDIFVNTAGGKTGISAGIGFMLIATALVIFTKAISMLGSLDITVLTNGLMGLAGALAIIILSLLALPKDILLKGAGLMLVSAAIAGIAAALYLLSGFSWDDISRSLVALGGSLLILTVALYAMSGTIFASSSLLIASVALIALATAMRSFDKISWSGLVKGLLALAGIFIILGAAGALLTPVIPTLVGLAGTIFLIGLAVAGIGAGIFMLASGFTALAVSASAVVANLSIVTAAIIGVIKAIFKGLGQGLIGFIKFIGDSVGVIIEVVKIFLLALLQLVIDVGPKLFETVMTLVETLLSAISDSLPSIIESGMSILLAILEGIASNIEDITKTAIEIVSRFIDGVSSQLPELIDSSYKFILAFINGLTDALDLYLPDLIQAFKRLGAAAVNGFIKGITDNQTDIDAAATAIGDTALWALQTTLGIHSPSVEMAKLAIFAIRGFVNGLTSDKRGIKDAITTLSEQLLSETDTLNDRFQIAGQSMMDRFISGFMSVDTGILGRHLQNMDLGDTDISKSLSKINLSKTYSDIGPSDDSSNTTKNEAENSGVTFIQNNYTPKPINRVELYRQTRNQLLQFNYGRPVS